LRALTLHTDTHAHTERKRGSGWGDGFTTAYSFVTVIEGYTL